MNEELYRVVSFSKDAEGILTELMGVLLYTVLTWLQNQDKFEKKLFEKKLGILLDRIVNFLYSV